MAERSLLQYQPVTGPVWSEPVASRMQWLPQGREFARGLPPNRLGDFVQPPFNALYKSERLEWIPSDRYAGRSLPRAAYDYSVLLQLISAPAYDPQTLEWLARATYPQIPVERRILGDFQQPAFDSLFKPERLQWFPADRYAGRSAARALNDWTVLVQLVTVQVYDPQNLEWQPRDRYFGVPLPHLLVDWSGDPLAPAPAPTPVPTAIAGTIGGIGRWTTQLPRPPQKPAPIVFKRNMENADRADLQDIADLLEALAKPKDPH